MAAPNRAAEIRANGSAYRTECLAVFNWLPCVLLISQIKGLIQGAILTPDIQHEFCTFTLTGSNRQPILIIVKRGLHHSTIAPLVRSLLIGALIYFGTVYPYVHFHSSHDDSFEVTLSLHPLGVDSDDLPDHDGRGHHHGLQRPTSGCVLVRQTAQSISLPQALPLPLAQFSPSDNSKPAGRSDPEDPPRLWSIYENQPVPLRGPPTLI